MFDPYLGPEDPLEKGMATHSSMLTWRIPWTEEPGGVLMGSQVSDMTGQLTLSLLSYENIIATLAQAAVMKRS